MAAPSRTILVLFIAVAFASTGMFAAITLGAIAAVDTADSRFVSGVPAAVAIAGTALGALLLGSVMERRGRRAGLWLGWLVGIPGGIVAAVAVELDLFWLLLPAMFAIGAGNAGSQLARYAAAEAVDANHRGSAVAWVVWAATIGAVGGPLALGPVGRLAREFGAEPGTGGFVLVAASMLAALLVAMLLPAFRSDTPHPAATDAGTTPDAPAHGLGATTHIAIATLIIAQAAMVAVMAITPVHLRGGEHAYGVIGTVMSGHFVGMFAFAPIVGWLVDRVGRATMMFAGQGVLVAGALVAAWMPVAHGVWLSVPLFLVGIGWCACFVSTSAIIASVLPPRGRARAQGRIDSLVWSGSATASLLSGLVLGWSGYAAVALVAAGFVAVAALMSGTTRAART